MNVNITFPNDTILQVN